MKRILVMTSLTMMLIACQIPFAAAQENSKPVPAFQIFDNLYYVGLDSVCAYILKTSGGLILVDTLYESSGGQHRQFKPIRRDLVIKDGDTLTLVYTTIKFYLT